MAPAYSGSCLCGGITFNAASEPSAVIECYCVHCSKGAGGASQVIAKMAHNDIAVLTGSDLITRYTLNDTASSAPKEKAFCGRCGATLWTVPTSAQGKFLMVRASLFSDWGKFRPSTEIFVKYRPEWRVRVQNASQWQEARH